MYRYINSLSFTIFDKLVYFSLCSERQTLYQRGVPSLRTQLISSSQITCSRSTVLGTENKLRGYLPNPTLTPHLSFVRSCERLHYPPTRLTTTKPLALKWVSRGRLGGGSTLTHTFFTWRDETAARDAGDSAGNVGGGVRRRWLRDRFRQWIRLEGYGLWV